MTLCKYAHTFAVWEYAVVFVCACVSQKGGSGKTTVSLHLAVAAQAAGYEAVIVDLDPQGTAEAWGGWRKEAPPLVISAKAGNLARTLERAGDAGAEIVIIDTPPLAQGDASAAARAASLVIVPCRPKAFDLHAVRITASLVEMTRTEAFVLFNGGHPSASSGYLEPEEVVRALGMKVAPPGPRHSRAKLPNLPGRESANRWLLLTRAFKSATSARS